MCSLKWISKVAVGTTYSGAIGPVGGKPGPAGLIGIKAGQVLSP